MRIFKGPSIKLNIEASSGSLGSPTSLVDAIFEGLKDVFGGENGAQDGTQTRRAASSSGRRPGTDCHCAGAREAKGEVSGVRSKPR